MPRRTDDFMARRPRTITKPDGTLAMHPMDVGPCAVDRAGNAIWGNITGSHGPRMRNGILTTLPSMIIPTGGADAPSGHKRRRKGGKPGCAGAKNRTLIKNALAADILAHGKLHARWIHRKLDGRELAHFLWLCRSLATAKQIDIKLCEDRERREVGRAEKARTPWQVMYLSGTSPAPAAPRPRPERYVQPKMGRESGEAVSLYLGAFVPKGK